ncbi:MAG: nucleotidyltransferase family protein [Solirubrobacteraceae bacterium]
MTTHAEFAKRAWSCYVDQVTAAVTAQFQAHGIDSILLKGPGFETLLYDAHDGRFYRDTDLLVQAHDQALAEQVLVGAGFVRIDRDEPALGPAPRYARTFRRAADGAIVDLHWRLSGAAAAPAHVWSILSAHLTILEVGGRPVHVLDAPASAFLVALHSAHHGTGRPKTLTDVEYAVARLDHSTWERARSLADALGASEPFAAGLRLTLAGDALADSLGLARPASVAMWLKTNPRTYGAWALDQVLQNERRSGRLIALARIVFPSPEVMRTFFPLARRGRGGLTLAYLLRPARLAVHASPALRDLARAARAVRGDHRPQPRRRM